MGNRARAGWELRALVFGNAHGRARPADGAVHGLARIFVADGIFGALVEHHQDVAAEGELGVHGGFGREFVRVAVEVGLEDHAFVGDLAQAGEAEDLESAGIGEDGARPRHEAVQSAHGADQVRAGAEVKMIGVGQQDADVQFVRSSRCVSPLTVAWVPTGMKTGVSMSREECASRPARARVTGHSAWISKENVIEDRRDSVYPRSRPYLNSSISFPVPKIVSCSRGEELADGSAAGRQDGVEDEAAFLADLVAVGMRKFVTEAVSAEQAELSFLAKNGAGFCAPEPAPL